MKRIPTTAGLIGLVLAAVLGFTIGNSSQPKNETETTSDRHRQRGDSPSDSPATIDPTNSDRNGSSPAPALSKRLRFLRYLASCDLDQFPSIFQEELARGRPSDRLDAILSAWVERDLDGHAAWLETQPEFLPIGDSSDSKFYLQGTLMKTLGEEDPVAAVAMAKRLRSDPHQRWTILTSTLKKDPAKALEIAQAHPDIYSQSKLYFVTDDSGPDPMVILPVIAALDPGSGRTLFVHDGSDYYASRPDEIEAAAQWFQQLPADAQRQVVSKLERRQFYGQPSQETLAQLREVWKLPEG